MTAEDNTQSRVELYDSALTLPSDSENYSGNNDLSQSTGSNSPMILYKPPTFWSLLRGAAINLVLPFVNGLMLGFGELFAHEAAFRLGWSGTKVRFKANTDWQEYCRRSNTSSCTIYSWTGISYTSSITSPWPGNRNSRSTFREKTAW